MGGNALLELTSTFRVDSASASGGFVFDYYGPTDFKYVTISAATRQITLGHRTASGWTTDATFTLNSLQPGVDYQLAMTLRGTTVNVTLGGTTVLSHAFNSLLTDGEFGLFARTGTSSFDMLAVRSDDPDFGGA